MTDDRLFVIGMKPRQDKTQRMIAQTGKIESGVVRIPDQAPWLD